MKKEELLKAITFLAYNVGFGAKKNFSSYDIIDKFPTLIRYSSLVSGVSGLAFPQLSYKIFSLIFIILSITALYISSWERDKEKYAQEGERLTNIFNQLQFLYREVKSTNGEISNSFPKQLFDLQKEFNSCSLTRQILFSNCIAHYKFFFVSYRQIQWINEEVKFTWRDKIPSFLILSLMFLIITPVFILSYFYLLLILNKLLIVC